MSSHEEILLRWTGSQRAQAVTCYAYRTPAGRPVVEIGDGTGA